MLLLTMASSKNHEAVLLRKCSLIFAIDITERENSLPCIVELEILRFRARYKPWRMGEVKVVHKVDWIYSIEYYTAHAPASKRSFANIPGFFPRGVMSTFHR